MHCKFCGNDMGENLVFPCRCENCQNMHYKNPLPVVVCLVESEDELGVVLVRRSSGPKKGEWALPGGFIESIDKELGIAASRELVQETGLIVPPEKWTLFGVEMTSEHVLIFVRAVNFWVKHNPVPPLNNETDAVRISKLPEELAFPTHTKMLARYIVGRHG